MTTSSSPASWWRDWCPLVVFLALAFYLRNLTTSEAQYHDFITHWTLVRLAVTGHGVNTYDFATQAALIRSELPEKKVEFLGSPQMSGTSVSPYPPTMVIVYAPLGFFSAATAARVMYVTTIVLAMVGAWAIGRSTAGRVSVMTAAAALLCYPGFLYTLALGQNAVLTLMLWSLGWLALVRGRDYVAGLCWGLLVYKIHWVVAVGWLPVYLGRPRALLGILTTAGLLALAATVWLGPDVWGLWLTQARAMSELYFDPAFTDLNKAYDLRGVLSRYLPSAVARPLGWVVLAVIGATAIGVDWWRRDRRADPIDAPGIANLLFACGLVVPYLFYYDETVVLLPLLVLWSHRAALRRRQLVWLTVLTAGYYLALWWSQNIEPRWDGPPWAVLVVLGLWLFSLSVSWRPPAVRPGVIAPASPPA